MYITGTHAIEEALPGAPKGSVLYVSSSYKNNDNLVMLAKATGGIVVKKVMKTALDEMDSSHRGAVLCIPHVKASFSSSQQSLREFLEGIQNSDSPYTVLLLDGITDPHNLGAILRSSDQFGVNLVVLPPSRSASINETVMRTSSGAAIYVKVAEGENINQAISLLKKHGFWIYTADMDGEDLNNVSFSRRSAIVMGAEGEGVHNLVKKNTDYTVRIPMCGHVDSLNVSVAAGIILYSRYVGVR